MWHGGPPSSDSLHTGSQRLLTALRFPSFFYLFLFVSPSPVLLPFSKLKHKTKDFWTQDDEYFDTQGGTRLMNGDKRKHSLYLYVGEHTRRTGDIGRVPRDFAWVQLRDSSSPLTPILVPQTPRVTTPYGRDGGWPTHRDRFNESERLDQRRWHFTVIIIMGDNNITHIILRDFFVSVILYIHINLSN